MSAISYDRDINYFTGVDRWESLISNNIEDPKNVVTGNVIVNDERALFNDEWKLYYRHFVYNENAKKTFELYNIQADPFEMNDLSSDHPDIFNSMKKTLTEMPVVLETPYINPVQSYLYGDRYIGIFNWSWLE